MTSSQQQTLIRLEADAQAAAERVRLFVSEVLGTEVTDAQICAKGPVPFTLYTDGRNASGFTLGGAVANLGTALEAPPQPPEERKAFLRKWAGEMLEEADKCD